VILLESFVVEGSPVRPSPSGADPALVGCVLYGYLMSLSALRRDAGAGGVSALGGHEFKWKESHPVRDLMLFSWWCS